MRQLRRADTNDSKIAIRIVADQVRGKSPRVGERNVEFTRAMNDVAVRENEAIRGDDKARAAAMTRTASRFILDANVNDRGRNLVHGGSHSA